MRTSAVSLSPMTATSTGILSRRHALDLDSRHPPRRAFHGGVGPPGLDPPDRVVVQIGPVEPLGEQRRQVLLRDLLGDGAECRFIDVLVFPPVVEGAQDPVHRLVTHHVAELVKEQLTARVDRDVVRDEVAVGLRHEARRLRHLIEIELQDVRLVARVQAGPAHRLPEPAGLEAGEAFVEPSLPPLVVRQQTHRVVVAELVDDQPLVGGAVVDHHRELGAAAFDPVHVGDLRPAERAVELVQPGQRVLGALDRDPTPALLVAGLIEHVDGDVAEVAALVAIVRVHRHGEVVHLLGVPADLLSPLFRSLARVRRRSAGSVVVTLVFDRTARCLIRVLPAGIATDRHAGGTHDLVGREVEVHQERAELAVELAGGIQRVLLPAEAVVDHDLGIPLGEIEPAPLPPLPARHRRRPGVPLHVTRSSRPAREGAAARTAQPCCRARRDRSPRPLAP